MNNIKISPLDFTKLMNEVNPKSGSKKYLCKKGTTLATFDWKDIQANQKCDLHPLTFRDITLLGCRLKKEIVHSPSDAQKVSQVLKTMIKKEFKKENHCPALLVLVRRIMDSVKNFFAGYGLKSSVLLAQNLCKIFDKASQVTANGKSPYIATKMHVATKIVEAPQTKTVTSTKKTWKEPPKKSGRSAAIEAYKIEAYKTDRQKKFFKTILFKDIKHIKPQGSLPSVVGLMLECSGITQVDLQNPKCARVLLDTFKHCNKETSAQLVVDLLETEKTFHPALLRECLEVYKKLAKNQKPYEPFALQRLVKIYRDNQWKTAIDAAGRLILPINDPLLVSMMSLLIETNHNDKEVEKLTLWMVKQPEFDLNSFLALLEVFEAKERIRGFGYGGISYALRNQLIEIYRTEKPNWVKQMAGIKYQGKAYLVADFKQPAILSTKMSQMPQKKVVINPSKNLVGAGKPNIGNTAVIWNGAALKEYKKDPQNCKPFFKTILFRDLKQIQPQGGAPSVVGLMLECSGLAAVNLKNTLCEHVILDIFRYCNENTSSQLVNDFLKNEKTFHPELLRDCFKEYKVMAQKHKPYSSFSLRQLLKVYIENHWHTTLDKTGVPVLSVNDPLLVSMIRLLIQVEPYSKEVEKLTLWFIKQADFDLKSFLDLLEIFEIKERAKGYGSIEFPLRDELINIYKERPHWAKEIRKDAYEGMRKYLFSVSCKSSK